MTANKREIDLLQDPYINKSTAVPEAAKQELGIVGLSSGAIKMKERKL